jgi:hypothetical protein
MQALHAHLAGISRTVAEGAHAIRVRDGAGWHSARALRVPDTITLLSLPSCPETRSGPDQPGLPARQPPRHLHLRHLRGHRRAVLRRLERFAKDSASVRSITRRAYATTVKSQGRWYRAAGARSSARHAACPAGVGTGGGRSRRQRSCTGGQRGWKAQPGGGSMGLGISPVTGRRLRPVIARSGTASSSIRL